jgi:hypothetical protein
MKALRSLFTAGAIIALGFSNANADVYKDTTGTYTIQPVTILVGCSNGSNCVGPMSTGNPLPIVVDSVTNSQLAGILTNTGAALPSQSAAVPVGGLGICDGANGTTNPCTTVATVKAASTAPAAADKALVVGLSPNNLDPCMANSTKTNVGISITSATQTSLVSAVSSKKIYICSIVIIAAAADIVNFYDVGSAGACSSAATEAVIGASSNAAANGLSLAANGGLTLGNGTGTVALTTTSNATLCVVTSSSGALSGNLTYVQQ